MKLLLCLAQLYLRISIGSGLILSLFHPDVVGNHLPAAPLAFIWLIKGILQFLFGFLLIIGYKTKLIAYLSTVLFSLTGMYFISNPHAYGASSGLLILAAAGGALFLGAMQGDYRWSVDNRNRHDAR